MAFKDIFNVIELADGTALGGMPTREQCADVRNSGYRCVINLAPHEAEGALADEASIWAELGLSYLNIPIPWNSPSLELLDQFVTAMDAVDGKKVFIHCQANFRVTAFYALYAMQRLGWSRDQSQALIDRIWNSRSDYSMDTAWQSFVAEGMTRIN